MELWDRWILVHIRKQYLFHASYLPIYRHIDFFSRVTPLVYTCTTKERNKQTRPREGVLQKKIVQGCLNHHYTKLLQKTPNGRNWSGTETRHTKKDENAP